MQVVFHSSVRTTFYPFGHPSRRKKFWLQYTILLWCMGLGKKNSMKTRSPPKKSIFSFLAIILLWGMGLEKINLTGPSPKKKCFFFPTTVLLRCTGLDPTEKKKLATTLDVLGTCEIFLSVLYTHWIRIVSRAIETIVWFYVMFTLML